MQDNPISSRRLGKRAGFVIAAIVAGAVALLAACGGGGGGSSVSSTANAGASANANGGGGANGVRAGGPAASGQIAEIDGNTMQVQSASAGQVAVDVTAKTTYTQAKAMTLAAVRVGSCIVATSAATSTGTATSSPTAQPTAQPTAITATDIVISDAVNGSCSRGFAGGQGGNGPNGSFTGIPSNFRRPSGAPSGFPTGANGQFRRAIGTTGLVTAVSGNTITVKSERRGFPNTATPSATTSPTTTIVTVTVTSSTKYTETVAATKAALKVGLCLTANGTTGSDGTVTASRVALSTATASGCDATFRGGFGGGGFGPGGAGGTGGTGGTGTVTSGG